MGFIEVQSVADINLPDNVIIEMFDILTGILEGLLTITNSSQEFKDLQIRIIKIIFSILVKNPSHTSNLEIDKEFFDALDLVKLLKSYKKET